MKEVPKVEEERKRLWTISWRVRWEAMRRRDCGGRRSNGFLEGVVFVFSSGVGIIVLIVPSPP